MVKKTRITLLLVAIATLSYLSVDIFYEIVDARLAILSRPLHDSKECASKIAQGKCSQTGSYSIIGDRNLFGSTDENGTDKEINLDELKETKLKLTLVGTVCSGSRDDCAVIAEKGKSEQILAKAGDTVAGAEIIKITRCAVVLRVGNRDEVLLMEERGNANDMRTEKETQGKTIEVSRADVYKALENMNQLLSQARIRPYFASGKPEGFMISRIKPGSIFDEMGISNGDVIQGVNGEDIARPDEMLKLYEKLRSCSDVAINIKRRGKPEVLTYRFK